MGRLRKQARRKTWRWAAGRGPPTALISITMARPKFTSPAECSPIHPEQDAASFFWRQVVANSPPSQSPAPAYENGWNAINQFIREDCSWNGREPNVLYRAPRWTLLRFFRRVRHRLRRRQPGFRCHRFRWRRQSRCVPEKPPGSAGPRAAQRVGNRTRAHRHPANWYAFESRCDRRVGDRGVWRPADSGLRAGRLRLSFATYQDIAFRIGTRPARAEQYRDPVAFRASRRSSANLEAGFRYHITEGDAQPRREPFAPRREPQHGPPRSRRTIGRRLKRPGSCFPFRFPSSAAALGSSC